jgi:hypothetical protein
MRSISDILMMMIWTSLQTIKLCMWKLALCWVNRRNFRLSNYRDWKCCRVTGHQSPASGAAASYLFHTRNGPVSINQPKGELCIWLVSNNKRTPLLHPDRLSSLRVVDIHYTWTHYHHSGWLIFTTPGHTIITPGGWYSLHPDTLSYLLGTL